MQNLFSLFGIRCIVFAVRNFIAQYHQAVIQMYIFDNDIRIVHGQIVMAEIPETAYPQSIQLLGNFRCRCFWHTQKSRFHCMLMAKAIQRFYIFHLIITDGFAYFFRVVIKNTYQTEAALFKGHVNRYGRTQMASTDQNSRIPVMQPQNTTDLLIQPRNGITIPLLSETAKAIKILPYL